MRRHESTSAPEKTDNPIISKRNAISMVDRKGAAPFVPGITITRSERAPHKINLLRDSLGSWGGRPTVVFLGESFACGGRRLMTVRQTSARSLSRL